MEYGTAKVDELEKNGSSIVENDSFSRGERFSAIRGHNVATPMEKYTSINFGRRMRWYIDLETKKCC